VYYNIHVLYIYITVCIQTGWSISTKYRFWNWTIANVNVGIAISVFGIL